MKRVIDRISTAGAVLSFLVLGGLPAAGQVPQDSRRAHGLTPVILSPGWGGTRLEVRAHDQSVAPECPRSGTFEYTIFPAQPSTEFSQTCQDRLLTLVWDLDREKPRGSEALWAPRVHAQHGVHVRVADYGKTESAPNYEPLFVALENAGYRRNLNLRVAGMTSG